MMRVLLAVDGSEPAKRAVTWAAQRFGAVEGVRFVLVHVEQTPVEVWAAAPAAGLGSAHELELMREIQELAHARPAQVLWEARGVVEELGIASDAIEEVVDKGTP
ncbi:MAG TPA: universal stress protein, partial [Bacillota bacterium]